MKKIKRQWSPDLIEPICDENTNTKHKYFDLSRRTLLLQFPLNLLSTHSEGI